MSNQLFDTIDTIFHNKEGKESLKATTVIKTKIELKN